MVIFILRNTDGRIVSRLLRTWHLIDPHLQAVNVSESGWSGLTFSAIYQTTGTLNAGPSADMEQGTVILTLGS